MLRQQIEALVFAADEPLTIKRLRELTGNASSEIREALAELEREYRDRGIRLCRVADGWQFRTDPAQAEVVRRLWQTRPPRLSRSLLETLAIIAYRQPVTRGEIEALRGVKTSSSVIATLQERGWIKVVGRKEVPGRPQLFATTRQFLVDFGLESLEDLPDASQLLDEGEIEQLVRQNMTEERGAAQATPPSD